MSDWCDVSQVGRHIAQGTPLGFVCSRESLAVIPLTNEQLKRVSNGSEVRVRIWQTRPQVLHSEVATIVQLSQLQDSAQWGYGQRGRAGMAERDGVIPPALVQDGLSGFAAVVHLPAFNAQDVAKDFSRPGQRVSAVFIGQPTSLFQRCCDWLLERSAAL